MKQIPRRATILCAAGAAVVAAAALPGAQALTGPGVIQIASVGSRHTHVDIGESGKSVGDIDVYASLLYNKRITPQSIGRATMYCTTVSSSNQSCSATYFLPKGEIVVQGVIGSRLIYAMPVVGGTGLYDNARGSLTVTSLKRRPSVRELLVFRLLV